MLYEGQFLVLYVVRDQLLMLASYHAGFTQGIPHPICATKPSGVEQLSTDIDEELSTMGTQSYTFLGFTGGSGG